MTTTDQNASEISSKYTVRLPQCVIDDLQLRIGRFVYFARTDQGYCLRSMQPLDDNDRLNWLAADEDRLLDVHVCIDSEGVDLRTAVDRLMARPTLDGAKSDVNLQARTMLIQVLRHFGKYGIAGHERPKATDPTAGQWICDRLDELAMKPQETTTPAPEGTGDSNR